MKILLINPPYSRLKGLGQAPYFPLGLGCLAKALGDVHHVRILNAENPSPHEKEFPIDKETVYRMRSQSYQSYQNSLKDKNRPVWQEIRQVLRAFKPDLVGITVMTVNAASAGAVSRLIKEWNGELPIVWGGVHPTYEYSWCLSCDSVDFVIRGEGEISFLSLANLLESGGKDKTTVPGLVYRQGNTLKVNEPASLITDLDTVFPPKREADLFPERYNPTAWGSIMASRGCPWKCAFCSSPSFWNRRLRYRDPIKVVDEIESLVNSGLTRHFTFWDDSFTANAKMTNELCDSILSRGLKITWKTATRIDLLDDELLGKMKKAGCIQLQIGIETGSPRMAQQLTKDIDPWKSIEAIKRIKKHGIGAGAFFMAGFPDEKEKDIDDTFNLMKELQADEIVINVFDPMPGSVIFEEMQQAGQLPETTNWLDFPLWPDRHFVTDIPQEVFNEKLEKISSWLFEYNNHPLQKWQKNKPELLFLIKYDHSFLWRKLVRFIKAKLFRKIPLFDGHSFRENVRDAMKLFAWKFGERLLPLFPLPFLYRVSDIAAEVFYRLDKPRRQTMTTELKLLLGDQFQPGNAESEIRSAFRNYLKEQVELFYFPHFTTELQKKRLVTEGAEHITAALESQNGVIALTAHFGSHLMPVYVLSSFGETFQLGTPPSAWEEMMGLSITACQKKIFNLRSRLEATLPVTFIFLNESMREVYRALKKNSIVIVAFDGRGGMKWKEMPFLHRKMLLSPGPFHIAYTSGTPIVPSFTIRENGLNRIVFHQPIIVDRAKKHDQAIEDAMASFLATFEGHLLRHPGHYAWLLQAARIRAANDAYPLFVDLMDGENPSSVREKGPEK